MDGYVAIPLMIVLLLLKGFFSGSEIALVNADRLHLRHRARNGERGAELALASLARPERLLATTLVGGNLSTIALTTVGTFFMIAQLGDQMGDLVAFLVFTPLFLVLGEIVPKSVYQQSSDRLVPIIIYPLRFFGFVFAPVIATFSFIARQVARLVGGTAGDVAMASREQLEQVVRLAEQSTTAAAFDRGRVRRVISFARVSAGEAMIPIAEVVAVAKDTPIRSAIRVALDRQIYRLPVFDGSTSNVIGLFRLDAWRVLAGKDLDAPVEQAAQQAFFAPTTQPLSTLLPELLHREAQLVVVVDEYGSAVGIITLNDIVKDVLGAEERLRATGEVGAGRGRARVAEADGSFVLDPHLPIVDFNELVGAELPTGEASTLAGFLLSRFQRLPAVGDTLTTGGCRFSVEAVNDRTITSVRVAPS